MLAKPSKAEDEMVVDAFEDKRLVEEVEKIEMKKPEVEIKKPEIINERPEVISPTSRDKSNLSKPKREESVVSEKPEKSEKPKNKKPTKPAKPTKPTGGKAASKGNSNPLMNMFGGNSKTADDDYDEQEDTNDYPEEFDNEFDALNAPSDKFYDLNTFDFLDGEKITYIDDEEDNHKDEP
jgi:hypothetical protein